MKRKRFFHIILLSCAAGRITGQDNPVPSNPNSFFTTECSVQMWKVGGYSSRPSVNQTSFPITLSTPLTDDIQLTLTTSPAFSSWGDSTLNGMSDTWIQGTYLLPNRNVMLSAGAGMPSGKTSLNNSQFELGQILSQNIFDFQVPIYGQGFCGKIGATAAFPAGKKAIFGIGAQYLYRGKYHPVSLDYSYQIYTSATVDTIPGKMDFEFKPGDELTGQVGVDVLLAENIKLLFDIEYTAYQKDQISGRGAYKSGPKSVIGCGFYYEFKPQYLFAYLTYRMKGKNEYMQNYAFNDSLPSPPGNQLNLNVVYKAYTFRDGGFYILGDFRIHDKNTVKMLHNTENNVKAAAYGGGVGVDFPLGENTFGNFRIKFFTGSFSERLTRNLFGMDASLGVKFLL
jgi:hypothetical protein